MTIGVAIVGCGLIGRKRAANLPAGTSLIACYDTDFARARDLSATATGEPAVAPTLHALLDRDDVALVLVATTHDTLCGVAAAAVDRGRHVLVEKPGAHRLEDLVSLRD